MRFFEVVGGGMLGGLLGAGVGAVWGYQYIRHNGATDMAGIGAAQGALYGVVGGTCLGLIVTGLVVA